MVLVGRSVACAADELDVIRNDLHFVTIVEHAPLEPTAHSDSVAGEESDREVTDTTEAVELHVVESAAVVVVHTHLDDDPAPLAGPERPFPNLAHQLDGIHGPILVPRATEGKGRATSAKDCSVWHDESGVKGNVRPDQSDQLRFLRLYDDCLADVYGYLVVRVGGDRSLAEDLTAETFTAAVRQIRDGDPAHVTPAWVMSVARRRLVDHWRRQSVASSKVSMLVGRRETRQPDHAERDLVAAALAAISPDQRTALVLQHVEGYSVHEVAEIIGRSQKATESLLTRARTAFRTAYERRSDD